MQHHVACLSPLYACPHPEEMMQYALSGSFKVIFLYLFFVLPWWVVSFLTTCLAVCGLPFIQRCACWKCLSQGQRFVLKSLRQHQAAHVIGSVSYVAVFDDTGVSFVMGCSRHRNERTLCSEARAAIGFLFKAWIVSVYIYSFACCQEFCLIFALLVHST